MNKITIEESVSNYIERLYFEEMSMKNIIDYLIERKVEENVLNQQLNKYLEIKTKFEQEKKIVAMKYAPEKLENYSYYNFDFETHTLEFVK